MDLHCCLTVDEAPFCFVFEAGSHVRQAGLTLYNGSPVSTSPVLGFWEYKPTWLSHVHPQENIATQHQACMTTASCKTTRVLLHNAGIITSITWFQEMTSFHSCRSFYFLEMTD